MDSDDDDDFMDMNLTGLDLNRDPTANQPIHRVTRYGSMLNELGTAHDRIEGRIRQLEAVTARARLRQRWRQSRNGLEINYSPGETSADDGLRSLVDGSSSHHTPLVQRTPERGKGCKRDSSHLVAKALDMGSEVKKPDKDGGGSFYDCNICLELAKEPVLTCCGHLFCWPCFYQVSHVDSFSKECPVCKGEVSDSTVTPIYGNGDSEGIRVTEFGLQIPPRPKASRVESARQHLVTQQSLLSHVPVSEALRRIRISIGTLGGGGHAFQPTGGSQAFQHVGGVQAESAGGEHHRVRFHQVSRVLSESAASLTSLSSVLSNAERLVENLESVINNRMLGNEMPALPLDVVSDLSRPTGFIRSIEETMATSSSFARRRNIMSRNLDLDARDTREPRRRRLN